MRGKRCARRYMQTLPCTSPNSTSTYRRNCREHFQWSHLYMCCSMWRPCTAPSTCRILLAIAQSDTDHALAKKEPQPRPLLQTMQMCGATTVMCMSMRSIISLRHFAPACMHDLFGRSRLLVHQPREGGRPALSLSGEPRDRRIFSLPNLTFEISLLYHFTYSHRDELISMRSGGLITI